MADILKIEVGKNAKGEVEVYIFANSQTRWSDGPALQAAVANFKEKFATSVDEEKAFAALGIS